MNNSLDFHRVLPLTLLLLLGFGFACSTPATGQNVGDQPVEELVVTGSSTPIASIELGRALTVLDRTDIENLGVEYAADLFRFVPGVAVSRSGGYGGVTQLRLRGGEGNHVLVLIDGIEVSEAGGGEFDFSSLLAADIERIEVLRGPQSGLYGSNALSGVIQIQTRRPLPGLSVSGGIEAGDNDTQQASLSVAGGSDRLMGRLSGIYRSSAFDLSADNSLVGQEQDQDLNRTLSGQLAFLASDALRFDLLGRFSNRHTDTDGFDFSGGPLQGLPVDDDSATKTEDLTLGLSTTLTLAQGRWVNRLSLEFSDNQTDASGFGSESSRQQVRARSTWNWADEFDQRTTVFVQLEEERYRNTQPSSPTQVPEQSRDLVGFGVEHRLSIGDQWFFGATARRDNNQQFDDVTTFSADLAWQLASASRLHASIGTGVTNPTFFEQFGFTPGQFKGNPALQPERSTGWDLGLQQGFADGAVMVDLTWFEADLEDEITPFFDLTDFLSTTVNRREDSQRSGLELSVDYAPTGPWQLSAQLTHLDADEPTGPEVRRPETTASLASSYTFAAGRARISANLIYNGSQLDTDFRNFFVSFVAEQTRLDSYTLLNLNGAYQLNPNIQAYLRIDNVLDDNYQEVLGFAAPGRSVFVGLRFEL